MSDADLLAAARALAAAGLVNAFGHVAARAGDAGLRITPPRPLGSLAPGDPLTTVALEAWELPAGVPGEAWIHVGILSARDDVAAVCRAQPVSPAAATAAGLTIRPLHGQGVFVGRQVPVFDDARLVRTHAQGEAVAARLGGAPALILRGNGAVTVGRNVGEAVARMWVLEASATLNLQAAAAGTPRVLDEQALAYWEGVAPEILARIWAWLRIAA